MSKKSGRKRALALQKTEGGEQFSTLSTAAASFASWLWGNTEGSLEAVTPYTVLGISAVLRSVSVISTTIASLPLRTYERQGDERVRVPSVFDDPFPGLDGQTPFAWTETMLIHLLLWREAFLWHEELDPSTGVVSAYRPIIPDAFEPVERRNGKRVFKYTNPDTKDITEVGSEQVTYIAGPSIDGIKGHPLLWAARNIFSAALSGDKAAGTTLSQGIRLAGLLTPGEGEDIDATEGESILASLRPKILGAENAGNIAFINRRLKLDPWQPTNVEAQWHETRTEILGEVGRLFGMPPHLLNDIEKQTSWGTGVAEQNFGLARYTLMGWSSRVEQVLSMRLPGKRNADGEQFCEYDYLGLLQGTPGEAIELIIKQVEAGLLHPDEARKILNLPPLTAAQKRDMAPPPPPTPPAPAELPPVAASRDADLERLFRIEERLASQPQQPPHLTIAEGAFSAPVTFAEGAFRSGDTHVATPDVRINAPITVEPTSVTIAEGAFRSETTVEPAAVTVTTPEVRIEPAQVNVTAPDVHVDVQPAAVTVEVQPTPVSITNEMPPAPKPRKTTKTINRDAKDQIVSITEEPDGDES